MQREITQTSRTDSSSYSLRTGTGRLLRRFDERPGAGFRGRFGLGSRYRRAQSAFRPHPFRQFGSCPQFLLRQEGSFAGDGATRRRERNFGWRIIHIRNQDVTRGITHAHATDEDLHERWKPHFRVAAVYRIKVFPFFEKLTVHTAHLTR